MRSWSCGQAISTATVWIERFPDARLAQFPVTPFRGSTLTELGDLSHFIANGTSLSSRNRRLFGVDSVSFVGTLHFKAARSCSTRRQGEQRSPTNATHANWPGSCDARNCAKFAQLSPHAERDGGPDEPDRDPHPVNRRNPADLGGRPTANRFRNRHVCAA